MNENSTISNAYDGKHDEYGHDLPRWMNFEHVIDIGEADPTQTATDYYGFELPNGVAMVIQSQPSHRDHPFIVYSYGDGACFHDDVEFDSLRTAISYASQLHSGAIDPDYLLSLIHILMIRWSNNTTSRSFLVFPTASRQNSMR